MTFEQTLSKICRIIEDSRMNAGPNSDKYSAPCAALDAILEVIKQHRLRKLQARMERLKVELEGKDIDM